MLTFYTILLNTKDAEGGDCVQQHFVADMDDVEPLLERLMAEGDTARVYQTDCRPPATAAEAVEWLRREPEFSLLMLVANVTRVSRHEAPYVMPVVVTSYMAAPRAPFYA